MLPVPVSPEVVELSRRLLHASQEGNVAEIIDLISRGARVDIKDQDGNTPLHLAAIARSTEACTALLSKGADPTVRNSCDESPLSFSAKCAPVLDVMLTHLEKKGTLMSFINEKYGRLNNTLMMIALDAHELVGFYMLFAHNASVTITSKYGYTALQYACKTNQKDIVQNILSRGGNSISERGLTPLYNAIMSDDADIVRILLDDILKKLGTPKFFEYLNGEGVYRKGPSEDSFVGLALKKGKNRAAEVLLEYVAGGMRRERLYSYLDTASMYCNSPYIFNTLMAQYGGTEEEKLDFFAASCRFANLAIMKRFFELGANPNTIFTHCMLISFTPGTPLLLACRSGVPAAVKLLLDQGARPELPFGDEGVVDILQASSQSIDIFRMLLNRIGQEKIAMLENTTSHLRLTLMDHLVEEGGFKASTCTSIVRDSEKAYKCYLAIREMVYCHGYSLKDISPANTDGLFKALNKWCEYELDKMEKKIKDGNGDVRNAILEFRRVKRQVNAHCNKKDITNNDERFIRMFETLRWLKFMNSEVLRLTERNALSIISKPQIVDGVAQPLLAFARETIAAKAQSLRPIDRRLAGVFDQMVSDFTDRNPRSLALSINRCYKTAGVRYVDTVQKPEEVLHEI